MFMQDEKSSVIYGFCIVKGLFGIRGGGIRMAGEGVVIYESCEVTDQFISKFQGINIFNSFF